MSKAGESGAAARSRSAAPRANPAAATDGLSLLAKAREGRFPGTLYLDGPGEALKAAVLAGLRHAWALAVPEAAVARILRPGEDDVDAMLNAYHGVSMFTPRELTIVLDIEELARSDKKVAALAAGLARPGGESTLVLVESAADTVRKSLEPLRAACQVRCSAPDPVPPQQLLAWGDVRLAAAGVTASAPALQALLALCEGEPVAFFNELSKLPALAEDGRVGEAQVALLERPVVGADLPDYLAALAAGDPGLAQRRLGRLLAAGEGEGAILFALSNLVGGAFGGWSKHPGASAALGRRLGPGRLARALDAVYRAEAAWKTGRLDAAAALEQATREVAGA